MLYQSLKKVILLVGQSSEMGIRSNKSEHFAGIPLEYSNYD